MRLKTTLMDKTHASGCTHYEYQETKHCTMATRVWIDRCLTLINSMFRSNVRDNRSNINACEASVTHMRLNHSGWVAASYGKAGRLPCVTSGLLTMVAGMPQLNLQTNHTLPSQIHTIAIQSDVFTPLQLKQQPDLSALNLL